MTRVRDLLPIGSVVLLNGGSKKLMVIGILQQNNGETYDYAGVLWPEGQMSSEEQFLFNHHDINETFHRGMEGPERDEFLAAQED